MIEGDYIKIKRIYQKYIPFKYAKIIRRLSKRRYLIMPLLNDNYKANQYMDKRYIRPVNNKQFIKKLEFEYIKRVLVE